MHGASLILSLFLAAPQDCEPLEVFSPRTRRCECVPRAARAAAGGCACAPGFHPAAAPPAAELQLQQPRPELAAAWGCAVDVRGGWTPASVGGLAGGLAGFVCLVGLGGVAFVLRRRLFAQHMAAKYVVPFDQFSAVQEAGAAEGEEGGDDDAGALKAQLRGAAVVLRPLLLPQREGGEEEEQREPQQSPQPPAAAAGGGGGSAEEAPSGEAFSGRGASWGGYRPNANRRISLRLSGSASDGGSEAAAGGHLHTSSKGSSFFSSALFAAAKARGGSAANLPSLLAPGLSAIRRGSSGGARTQSSANAAGGTPQQGSLAGGGGGGAPSASATRRNTGSVDSSALRLLCGGLLRSRRSARRASQRRWATEYILERGLLRHANVLALIGATYRHGLPYVVEESTPNGRLSSLLARREADRPGFRVLAEIAVGVAAGVRYLHESRLVVALRPSAVLLTEKLEPKVRVGARQVVGGTGRDLAAAASADRTYEAPEAFAHSSSRAAGGGGGGGSSGPAFTFESDAFAFGVMMYELFAGRFRMRREPALGRRDSRGGGPGAVSARAARLMLERLSSASADLLPRGLTLDIRVLIMDCIDRRPERRPKFTGDLSPQLADAVGGALRAIASDEEQKVARKAQRARLQALADKLKEAQDEPSLLAAAAAGLRELLGPALAVSAMGVLHCQPNAAEEGAAAPSRRKSVPRRVSQDCAAGPVVGTCSWGLGDPVFSFPALLPAPPPDEKDRPTPHESDAGRPSTDTTTVEGALSASVLLAPPPPPAVGHKLSSWLDDAGDAVAFASDRLKAVLAESLASRDFPLFSADAGASAAEGRPSAAATAQEGGGSSSGPRSGVRPKSGPGMVAGAALSTVPDGDETAWADDEAARRREGSLEEAAMRLQEMTSLSHLLRMGGWVHASRSGTPRGDDSGGGASSGGRPTTSLSSETAVVGSDTYRDWASAVASVSEAAALESAFLSAAAGVDAGPPGWVDVTAEAAGAAGEAAAAGGGPQQQGHAAADQLGSSSSPHYACRTMLLTSGAEVIGFLLVVADPTQANKGDLPTTVVGASSAAGGRWSAAAPTSPDSVHVSIPHDLDRTFPPRYPGSIGGARSSSSGGASGLVDGVAPPGLLEAFGEVVVAEVLRQRKERAKLEMRLQRKFLVRGRSDVMWFSSSFSGSFVR